VTVRANASDDHGVTPVEFFVGTTSIGVDTDGSNGRSVPWSRTAFPHGDYTLTGTATDPAGQTSSGVPVTIANPVISPTNMGGLQRDLAVR
jgi:hypothetical protein